MHFVAEQVKILMLCFLRYRAVRFAKEQDRLKWRNRQFPAFFVRAQVRTRWEPELRVSCVEGKALITARATPNVPNAKEPENQVMACLVHVAAVKDYFNNTESPMNITGNTIMKSLQKRQEAMLKHVARKEAFLIKKELMIKDIEKARTIWIKTMEQLPKTEFQEF